MRFRFDDEKNSEVLRKHGISLEAAQEIFDQAGFDAATNKYKTDLNAAGDVGKNAAARTQQYNDLGDSVYNYNSNVNPTEERELAPILTCSSNLAATPPPMPA